MATEEDIFLACRDARQKLLETQPDVIDPTPSSLVSRVLLSPQNVHLLAALDSQWIDSPPVL